MADPVVTTGVTQMPIQASGAASNTNSGGGEPTAGEVLARMRADRERVQAISALAQEAASQRGADLGEIERIAAQAETERWTVQQTELAFLRASRPRAVQARGDSRPTQPVLEAALAMSCGISDAALAKDRDYGEQVVSAAWKLRGRGLRGILAAAMEAGGVSVPHGGREFYGALQDFTRGRSINASGFSNVNVPGIIGNVANKMLLDAFTAQPGTYTSLAKQSEFGNFHTHTHYRLDHLGEFAAVGQDGELKNGSLAETSYTNKLETYGQILTLTRQQIINDDLNAFTSLVAQLGRKAKTSVERALYLKIMEASDSFYTSARGNKITSNALSITALGAARAAMSTMVDAGGDPLDTAGKFLLVPRALEPLAMSIFTSTFVNETTTTDKAKPTNNPYLGQYQPVSSAYLSVGSGGGQSATTWYLLADPTILPAFEVAYLEGQRQPTIETADADFNTLGMQMRAFWDFGVAQIDYRGAVKNVA